MVLFRNFLIELGFPQEKHFPISIFSPSPSLILSPYLDQGRLVTVGGKNISEEINMHRHLSKLCVFPEVTVSTEEATTKPTTSHTTAMSERSGATNSQNTTTSSMSNQYKHGNYGMHLLIIISFLFIFSSLSLSLSLSDSTFLSLSWSSLKYFLRGQCAYFSFCIQVLRQ